MNGKLDSNGGLTIWGAQAAQALGFVYTPQELIPTVSIGVTGGDSVGGSDPQNPGVTVTVSAQIPPMEQVDCPGGEAESARGRGSTVILNYADGTREVRRGGSRSWRNDNPGNIRPGNLQGEIGSAGGFAVFSSKSAGKSAIVELLSRPAYQALTVFGAINR